MARNVEHLVEVHEIATERRNAGLPIWDCRINFADVFHSDELSFEQRRDAIVSRLRSNQWYSENLKLEYIVDYLEDSDYPDEFDYYWDDLYDEADRDRVWIETR